MIRYIINELKHKAFIKDQPPISLKKFAGVHPIRNNGLSIGSNPLFFIIMCVIRHIANHKKPWYPNHYEIHMRDK